ncbi:hypothetical protein J2X65_001990 [Ancylobacter sp. 3268]|uniref:hypothetical protein n=1 Tax=Ancylobacter sp. 3268 TaxID=2817752 RepID=UPI0028561675|nr:hypothetical protein [Ancylobacter sp. 3268]MDR6952635.1 hypothetical protein [Ancylobacter sp. 3268]
MRSTPMVGHGGLPLRARPGDRAGGGFATLLPAVLLLLLSTLGTSTAMLAAGPGTEHVAVVAPPWYEPAQTLELVARAGGRIVDMGRFDNMVVAVVGDDEARQGFPDALRREGAWLALDAGFLNGCVGR